MMKVWCSDTPPSWGEGVAAGKWVDLGVNFSGAVQDWYVPKYVIEGPKAPAKTLKSVTDLGPVPKSQRTFGGWCCALLGTPKKRAPRTGLK